jgi:hypothetical protein
MKSNVTRSGFVPAALVAACIWSACSAPASATLFCPVMKTRDGFVALRAAPNMQASILVKMRPRDEIMLTGDEENGWIKVLYWPGETRFTRGYGEHRSGWMHRRFVPPDQCG